MLLSLSWLLEGALLPRILRIRAFALDSSVLLNLHLLLLLLRMCQSLPFPICSTLVGLLGFVEAAKAGSPDIMDSSHDVLQNKGCGGFILERAFKEALVDGFLTRVSGQPEVGEKDDGGHCRAYHAIWKGLVMA